MSRPFDKRLDARVMASEQQVMLTHLHEHRVTLTQSVLFFQHYAGGVGVGGGEL